MFSSLFHQFVGHQKAVLYLSLSCIQVSPESTENFHSCLSDCNFELNLIKESLRLFKSKLLLFSNYDLYKVDIKLELVSIATDSCLEYIKMKQLPTSSSFHTLETEISGLLTEIGNIKM